jgi:hypothetical protein
MAFEPISCLSHYHRDPSSYDTFHTRNLSLYFSSYICLCLSTDNLGFDKYYNSRSSPSLQHLIWS